MPVFRLKNISKESFKADFEAFSNDYKIEITELNDGYFFKRLKPGKISTTYGFIEIEAEEANTVSCAIKFNVKKLFFEFLLLDLFLLILFIATIIVKPGNITYDLNTLAIFVVVCALTVIIFFVAIKIDENSFIKLFKGEFSNYLEDNTNAKTKHILIKQKHQKY